MQIQIKCKHCGTIFWRQEKDKRTLCRKCCREIEKRAKGIAKQEREITVRAIPELTTKQQVDTLLMMENLGSAVDMEKQYKDWMMKRMYDIFPTVMNRLYGPQVVHKEETQGEKKDG